MNIGIEIRIYPLSSWKIKLILDWLSLITFSTDLDIWQVLYFTSAKTFFYLNSKNVVNVNYFPT